MGDIVVSVIPTEDLSARQREAIIDVCIRAHDNTAFEGLFTFVPSGGRHIIGSVDGAIASHAVVTTRWAQPHGHPVLRTAFVDAVSTAPSFQSRGIASAVMRKLGGAIDDYEMGCLQTDIPAFYERLGWEVWRGSLGGRDGDTFIPTPEQRGVMVLRVARTPALDLDALLTIERQPSRIWE